MSTKTILIATKYDMQSEFYSSELSSIGYNVIAFADGRSAGDKLLKGGIDLVVMGSNGLGEVELLEKAISSLEKKPKIIVHTAHAHPESLYKNSPINPYIEYYVVKSANPTHFISAVERAIGAP